jgi:hypothetical protein
MKTVVRGIVFGFVGGVVAFGLAVVEGIRGAFGAAAGSISPSPYLIWGIVPVVATAFLSRFIGRKEASIAVVVVLGVVLWRCWSGYGGYLKEGGIWAKAAPQWLSLMIPMAAVSLALSGFVVVLLPKATTKEPSPEPPPSTVH